jgi:glycosyltransferase involved in cell wall biosynthesis
MIRRKNNLDISVLIATYNRAEILRQTLEDMTHLDRDGISVEFVVIDNNSSDHTKQVVESFSGKLPIRYLFERRQGKNCALNKALDKAVLGKLVVFTDDDVEPKTGWLKAIMTVSHRWPDYKVFGGKQFVKFPDGNIPKWAYQRDIQRWGYALHDWVDSDTPYPSGIQCHPSGANFWVRREIFEDRRRFDESMGPQSSRRYPMGSEASFVLQLRKEGFGVMYSPDAVVGHKIHPNQLLPRYITRRAICHGVGLPHLRGISYGELLEKSPGLWYLQRLCVCAYWIIVYAFAKLSFFADKRVEKSSNALRWLAYHIESLRLAMQLRRRQ